MNTGFRDRKGHPVGVQQGLCTDREHVVFQAVTHGQASDNRDLEIGQDIPQHSINRIGLAAIREIPDDHARQTCNMPAYFEMREHSVDSIEGLPLFLDEEDNAFQ